MQSKTIMKCCICQRIRTDKGWDYQFMVLAEDETFAHGYCPRCYQQALREIESDHGHNHGTNKEE